MTRVEAVDWPTANQRYLTCALNRVRGALELQAAPDRPDAAARAAAVQTALDEAAGSMPAPPALETLCSLFALSSFERDLLLLCAGMEFDAGFGACCAAAQGEPARTYPTFGLALAALPDPHWSALSPAAPLRHWRLVEVGAGSTLTTSPLRIDERILHFLAGVPHLDDRLVGLVERLTLVDDLVPSQQAVAERIVAVVGAYRPTGPPRDAVVRSRADRPAGRCRRGLLGARARPARPVDSFVAGSRQ